MFKRSLGKKNLVGLDIGSSSVKAVELQGKPGSLQLTSLGYETLQPDTVVDGQIMELNDVSNAIAGLFSSHQIKTDRVAAGVSGSSVIVKNIIVPQMSEEELEESIDWHAEEHIPFDIADVSLDYQIVGSGSDSLHVLMAACKRDSIANLKQAIQLAGKSPAVIDVDAFALQNCYELNYEPRPDQTVALLNIGAATMNINILKGTQSVFTRDVSVGGNQYTALLQKELGLTFEQAEAVKRTGKAPEGTDASELDAILFVDDEVRHPLIGERNAVESALEDRFDALASGRPNLESALAGCFRAIMAVRLRRANQRQAGAVTLFWVRLIFQDPIDNVRRRWPNCFCP
jgi:type IV pilus assembly protein PilM